MAAESFLLNNEYRIFPGERIHPFDLPEAPAFAVHHLRDQSIPYFALLLSPLRPLPTFADLASDVSLVWPKAAGIVPWPDMKSQGVRECPVLIYQKPNATKAKPPGEAMSEIQLTRNIIQPAWRVLQALSQMGRTHRSIRPDNLFYKSDGSVIFGDCLSSPPAMNQPSFMETVESALTLPIGRGPGRIEDDLYSLGILIACFALGKNPLAGMSDAEIIEAKVAQGSFRTLLSKEKLSPRLEELLRGLLADRLAERWSLRTLEKWVNGQGVPANLPNMPSRASRSIQFAEKEYWTRPALACAMNQNWQEAAKLVVTDEFDHWLRRAFSDQKNTDHIEKARLQAQSHGPAQAMPYRLAARMLFLLSSGFPICYRGIHVDPQGLGFLLADRMDRTAQESDLRELLQARLIQAAIDQSQNGDPAMTVFRRQIDELLPLLDRNGPGFGIKRLAYELMPGLPCRSPLLGASYVATLPHLLPTLNANLTGANANALPMDDHLASFIAAHLKSIVSREIIALQVERNSPDGRMAILKLMAVVARASPPGHLPNLANSLLSIALSLITEFVRNRDLRTQAEELLRATAARSDFTAMVDILSPEGELRTKDERGFLLAKNRYARLAWEARWLEGGGLTEARRVKEIAQRHAAAFAAFSSAAFLAFFGIWIMMA